ncbi:MAG: four helix bundle protein [Candidatus Omnitrophota bacterium]
MIETNSQAHSDRKHYRLIENLEASCTSIAFNIAEGKGRFSKKEFIQFLYVARGSLYETVSQLISGGN